MTTNESSANSENLPKAVLRVVPPAARPTQDDRLIAPPEAIASSLVKPKRQFPYKTLLVLGVFSLGFIPTRYEIGGTATLAIDSQNRQLVTSPIDGIITDINPNLQPGSKVQAKDVIAKLHSRNLEAELSRTRQELNQAREQLQQQRRKQAGTASQIEMTTAEQAALEAEGEMKRSLATGDRSSRMQVLDSQITSSQTQLAGVEADLARIAPLEHDKAISQAEANRMRRERDKYLGDIASAQREKEALQQAQADEAERLKNQAQTKARIAFAQQPVLSADREERSLQAQIETLEERAKKLGGDQENLTLRAEIDGEITQGESIPKKGQELKLGQPLVSIINLQGRLTGVVEIDEHDNTYIQLGKSFRFRPTQNKLRTYEGKVLGKDPSVKSTDPTGQKKVVRIAIEVQNPDGELRDGSTGYARIESQDMIWYQRIWRELENILGLERI